MNNKKLVKSVKNILASVLLAASPQFFFNPVKAVTEVVSPFTNGAASTNHAAQGYTAGGATVYSVDVFWAGNMTFVFDNGVYNPNTGAIVSSLLESSENSNVITQAMAEKDVTGGTIKKWYGFDGLRNRLVVLNRSNAAITAAYAATTSSDSFGENVTALQLYDYAANNSQEGYPLQIAQTAVMDNTDPENPQVVTQQGMPTDLGDATDALAANRFGSGTALTYTGESPTNVKTLKGAVSDSGYMYANKIFFNITGTPVSNFPTEAVSAVSIGTITITFNKV